MYIYCTDPVREFKQKNALRFADPYMNILKNEQLQYQCYVSKGYLSEKSAISLSVSSDYFSGFHACVPTITDCLDERSIE